MCGRTRDVVICSTFHRNPFRGFGAPGGQNLAFPITLAIRFYNRLYYRTSRDITTVGSELYNARIVRRSVHNCVGNFLCMRVVNQQRMMWHVQEEANKKKRKTGIRMMEIIRKSIPEQAKYVTSSGLFFFITRMMKIGRVRVTQDEEWLLCAWRLNKDEVMQIWRLSGYEK